MKRLITVDEIKNYATNSVVNISPGTILTPSARDYAKEKGIQFREQQVNEKMDTGQMNMNKKLVEDITALVMEHLGENSTTELVQSAVGKVIERLKSQNIIKSDDEQEKNTRNTDEPFAKQWDDTTATAGNRIILTALGENRPGIVAGLSGVLAAYNCDIEDISQRILQEFFTMIMIINTAGCKIDFATLKDKLIEKGKELGIRIIVQHEAVFRYMHRV